MEKRTRLERAIAHQDRRFWAKVHVDPETGCWLWTASLDSQRYAQFRDSERNRPVRAYRWAYMRWVGPVPDGLELDHLCRVRHCVNPAHLEPVTHAENVRRGRPFREYPSSSACFRGHTYSGRRPDGRPYCNQCERERRARLRRRGAD